MILNKELENIIFPIRKVKSCPRPYELAKGNNPLTHLDSIDNIDKILYAECIDTGITHFSKKCDLFFIYKEDITVSKHIRYYPYFMHKHYFYEIIYQLTGRHIINNMDISMEEGNL